MKSPFEWSERWQEAFGRVCSERWGFRYKSDDLFTLRHVVERAYQASDAANLASFAALLAELPDGDPEVQAFVGQMTVGETGFFRNRPQFEILASTILPEIVAERRERGERRLRIWSAGCASGEEPYSVAILVAETLPDWRDWDVVIHATDINPFSLRRAKEALYSAWSFREADPEVVERYFTKMGRLYKFDHPSRALVRFRRQNLATDPVPDPALGLSDLDVILCRNVTIYFDRDLTARLARSFRDALRPGGWLLVGHAEPDLEVYRDFDALYYPDTVVYRRPEPGGAPARISGSSGAVPAVPAAVEAPRDAAPAALRDEPTIEDAFAAYEARDLAAADEILAVLSRRSAEEPLVPHLLAQISADQKRYDEARFWAFTALQRDSFHVPSLLLMGLVQLETGEARRAKEHFKQALFLDPKCPEAHLYLSMAHQALGDDDLAIRSREKAERLAREAPPSPAPLLPVQRARVGLARSNG